MTADSATTLSFYQPVASSYTVPLTRIKPWLFQQAEQAGAQCLTATQVYSLDVENGMVSGVVIDGEVLSDKAVVIAEGANTLLAEQHKLLNKLPKHSEPRQLLKIYYETADNQLRRHDMGLRIAAIPGAMK